MAVIINGELVEVVALPDQTGHAGEALVTDGTSADWAALAGTGDMAKATYDTNHNGIVDQAAAVNDGAGNSKTAAQIKTHIDSTSNPHNVTAAQVGAAATPSGTGMIHVTAGVQDAASKLVVNADVDAGAAIAESKLSLNNPTHSNVNDPSSDQKNALVGTNGTPYSGNRYVTDSDPRNTNTRTPVAHGSAQHTGTIGTPTQVGLSNVPNVDATNATNIVSGTLPAARLPAMSAGAKGGVPATGAPSGKYLKDDGTWDSPAGAGDMAKATYDTTNNSIVDKAETVDDGAGNSATAAAIKTALTTTIPGKADLVAGATNGHLAGLDAGGNLTDSGNEPADFAPAAKGVTDGDSHDHTGGAGAAITEDALSLSNVTTGDVDNTKHGFCPITPNDANKFLRGDATWAAPPAGGAPPSGTGWRHVTAGVEDAASSTPTKTDVGLGNVANLDQTNPTNITQDATHRFATDAEKSAWNAKLDPSGSGANLTGIPEGALSLTNVNTNNVSITKHGFCPIAPNDTAKYLRGDGSWANPPGSGDVVGAGTPVVGDIAQYTNVDGKHVSPATRIHYNAVDHGSAVRHASNDIGATFRAWIAGLSNCVVVFPPCAAGTYYNFTSDLETIPATVVCVAQKGAMFNIGTVSVTGNLTCAFTAGVNLITTRNSSAYVSNVDSGILPGQYIKTAGANYYRVHQMVGTDCIINTLVGVAAGEAGVAFSSSPLVIGGANLDTQFEHGDIAYVAGLTLPISRVKDATNIWTYDWIPQEFNAAATRSVRVKFPGGIEAGQYQIFTGDGVAKLDHATTPNVYPIWWGATANGASGNATTNRKALNKASICFLHGTSAETTAGKVILSSGDYYVDGPVKYGCVTMSGTGSGMYTGKSCIRAAATPFPGLAVLEPYPNLQATNTVAPGTGTYSGAPIMTLEHFQVHSDYQTCSNGYIVDSILDVGAVLINDVAFQNGGCCVRSAGGNMKFIDRCFMTGMENGFFMTNEGHIRGCKGQWGAQLVGSPDFSDGTKWTSTNWTLAGSKATHTAGNTSSLTQNAKTQGGTGACPYAPGVPMLIKLIISGGSAGTITLKSFGATILGSYGTLGTYYFWATTPMDIWTNPLSVEVIPSNDFDKAVQVWIYYGGAFYGGSTTVCENDWWSDGPLGAFGIFPTLNYVRISDNFIHPCGVGVVLESGKFYHNGFDSCLFGGIMPYVSGFVAEGNVFSTSVVGGIHIPSNMSVTDLSLFRDNVFDNGAVPNFYGWSDGSHFPTGFSELIIEDNLRADKAAKIVMEAGSATPSVLLGKRFSLDQAGATNITNFVDGYDGKDIEVYFVDNLTTLKFSDANHYLKGNSTVDWTSAAGDILRATYDGTGGFWDCVLYQRS